MIKPRIQIGLAVVAMATLVPMTAFPQANEGTKEVTSSVAEIAVDNTQQSSGENNTNSGFSKNSEFQTLPNVATNFVGVQTQFNEIRRELLDERASSIDLWLAVIGIILTFFGVVVVIAGFMGFRKFREIEEEAKASANRAAAAEEDAKHHLQEILNIREEAAAKLSDLDARFAAENPTEAYQTVTKIRENPAASSIEKAIADAVSLQQQGKQKDAVKKWRAIAEITEENDHELAARAWVSIAYLIPDEDITEKLSSYNRAIQLKPTLFVAYVNRGILKATTGQHKDAMADFDEAIQLNPDLAEAYGNRGIVNKLLGQHKDAMADYNKAIELDPDMAEAYSNRGIVNMVIDQHKDAMADFNEAIQLDPDMVEAYLNRGLLNSNLGFKVEGKSDLETALELAKNSDDKDLITQVEQNLHKLNATNGD